MGVCMPLSFREAVALHIPDSLDLQEIAVDYLRGYLASHYPGISRTLAFSRIYCVTDDGDGSCALWIQYPPGKAAQIGWAIHQEKLDRLVDIWHRITGLSQVVVIGPAVGKILVTIGEDPATGCQVCDRVVVGGGEL